MLDAIVLSDLHLGSRQCQGRLILQFLTQQLPPSEWIFLNGDIVDSWNLARLKLSHRKVLSALRTIMGMRRVVWIMGNHEDDADMASDLLGVVVNEHSVCRSGDRSFLVMHGHQFKRQPHDLALVNELSRMDDAGKPLGRPFTHRREKIGQIRRAAEGLASVAVKHVLTTSHHGILCGHTHYGSIWPICGTLYANSGTWAAKHGLTTGTWLGVRDGDVRLHAFSL